jgi:type I restriction enzyme S subunit
MTNWKDYKFSDFVEINPKVALKKGVEYSFVEMKDLSEGSKFVSPSQKRELKGGSRFENGDTLFARITPCLENGKISQVKELENGVGFGSTEFLVFRGKKGVSNTNFVHYLSLSDEVRSFAEQNMVGTSGRQRVSWQAFENLEISLPDLPTQTAIAEILSSLDDKIELNNKINQELENLAQTLFKQWFIDFEFPANLADNTLSGVEGYKSSGGALEESELGEIPKGWELVRLGDKYTVADFVANGSFASLKENVTILETPSFAIFLRNTDSKSNFTNQLRYVDEKSYNFLSKSRIIGNEICISNVADVGTVFRPPIYLKKPMTLGNNLVFFRSNYPNYFYLYFKYFQGQDQIQSITSGSAQLKFNKTDFRNLNLLDIPKAVLSTFEDRINDLWELQSNLLSENIELTTLRDTLLPKLISGELEVSQALTQTTA